MRALLDLLMPPRCPGCGLEGAVLCDGCQAPLRRRLHEPPGVPLGVPARLPEGVLQLEWCATYSGPVRAALHAFKYRGERRLSVPLSRALAERWQQAGRGGELVTWVPVHASRRRERGFDQAEELARAMAAELGLPAVRCLERRQRTTAQHALGQAQRASNTAGAFVLEEGLHEHIAGRWVIVVDDIMTTGATLGGCARALLAGGAAAVSAVTVARDR
ncbi:MAG: phosphoribosyltransferase family protein [Chloroflexota bacterium]|jgi:ComF family protein